MKKTLTALILPIALLLLASCGHTHEFTDKEVLKEPTCTEEGKIVYTCSCGKTKEETAEKIKHVYENSEVTTPSTTKTEGVLTYFCKCGDTITESIPVLTPYEGLADYIMNNGTKLSNAYRLEFDMPVASSSIDHKLACEYNENKNTITVYSSIDYSNGMSTDFTLYLEDNANRYEWEAEAFLSGAVIFVAGGDVNPRSFTSNSSLSYTWSNNGVLGAPPSSMIETLMGFFAQSLNLMCTQLNLNLDPAGVSVADLGFINY